MKLDHQQERQVIGRARSGDSAALRQLVELHNDRLYAFIWRMVRNHHDTEEVCQDAFLRAFSALDTFSCDYRFSTWLFTIAYRVCLNHLRRRRPFAADVELATLPGAFEDAAEMSAESEEASRLRSSVWAAVDRLSPPQRASVLLFYRNAMSCQEIARVLSVPVATVKSHLHRARNRLRDMLATMEEEDLQDYRNRLADAG